jgi:hypothetical protein
MQVNYNLTIMVLIVVVIMVIMSILITVLLYGDLVKITKQEKTFGL